MSQTKMKVLKRRVLPSSVWAIGAAICLMLGLYVVPVHAVPPSVSEVAKELICPCPDCGKQALDQCPTCGEGQKYRGVIAAQIKEGKGKDQIITYFADQYGEHMLGNPRPRGIGQIATLVPWVGSLLGLAVVGLILGISRSKRRAGKNQLATSAAGKAATPTAAAPDDPRLSTALRDFDY